ASSTRSRRRRPISGWVGRSRLTCSRPPAAPRSSAPRTSPPPCRPCASTPRSGAPNDRHRVRDRACAARLSRRDAARIQGWADVPARPRARDRSRRGLALRPAGAYRRLRSGRRGREQGLLRPALSADRGGRRRRGGWRARPLCPGRRRARDRAQAARADRRDLCRCRGHHHPQTPARRLTVMADALVAFGGNVGDARLTLDRAVAAFCDGREVRLRARSSDYRTPPWGVADQPPFVNLCLAVETGLTPHALLARAQAVERAFGRDRGTERRWGPRPLDIDLIAYDDLALHDGDLTLPHPRLFERAFVLVPL